ncbi:MAG TPA: Gfo/Idh/MocA family oxidoreductase, partial [Parapedobacter sp.]|nr:Gfo/Idh/MocA family oxidoreductase [Parapedobacter sp.]
MINNSINRKLRMGMVGGGKGAFIGEIHRIAAAMDGQIELVCGAFSSDPARSKESGDSLYLPADRVYGSYREMIAAERALPEDKRMDFVSIVTPNHAHFEPAMLALENGFHVVLDKPMTLDLEEARQLQQKVEETGLLFLLTHT